MMGRRDPGETAGQLDWMNAGISGRGNSNSSVVDVVKGGVGGPGPRMSEMFHFSESSAAL